MHPSPKLLALAAAAFLSSTTSASPLNPTSTYTSSSSLQTSPVNCTNVSTGLSPTCWFALNMTAYFNAWVASSPYSAQVSTEDAAGSSSASTDDTGNPFSSTVTTGNSSSDFFRKRSAADPASGQCEGGKPFATCFLQLLPGYVPGKTNCSAINVRGANGTCPAPRAVEFPNDPRAYYAAWNFYSINAYLSALHLTLATSPSPGLPSYFADAPARRLSIDTPLLALLARSTGGHERPGGANTPFLHLLEGAPSNVTYGRGTSAEELAGGLQGRVREVLGGVMGDERVFVGVAGNGAFSGGRVG